MKNFFRLLKKAKPYWWLLIITGISLIAITALNLVTPWKIRELVDVLSKGQDSKMPSKIQSIAVILVLVYVGRAVFTYLYRYLSHLAAWQLVADMRVQVYEHLQKLSLRYYQDKQT
ncbi:MAG: ABC transporter transmembrane domain-containing protein, partial [Bacillota bacterium]